MGIRPSKDSDEFKDNPAYLTDELGELEGVAATEIGKELGFSVNNPNN